jgi:hypothetical protein
MVVGARRQPWSVRDGHRQRARSTAHPRRRSSFRENTHVDSSIQSPPVDNVNPITASGAYLGIVAT